jgi:hypothetical protein
MNESNIKFEVFIIVMVILAGCIPVACAENTTSAANLTNLTPASATTSAVPFIAIYPIGNHTIGEGFFINGTTNLPVSDDRNLLLTIKPTNPRSNGINWEYSKYLAVVPGSNGINQWSDIITESDGKSGEYFAEVSSKEAEVNQFQTFNLVPAESNAGISPILTQLTSPASSIPVSNPPYITIDSIGNKTIGEVFIISGTTNLPVSGNQSLILTIKPDSSNPGGRDWGDMINIWQFFQDRMGSIDGRIM